MATAAATHDVQAGAGGVGPAGHRDVGVGPRGPGRDCDAPGRRRRAVRLLGNRGARGRACRDRGRQAHRAREQGSAGDGWRAGDGGGARARRRRAAGRQRAQRHPPMPGRAPAVARAPAGADGLGWTLPQHARRGPGLGDRRRRPQPPDLEDGAQDHHRFGHHDEQGPRGDRGALAVRHARRSHRRGHPSPVGGPLDGRVRRTARCWRNSASPT